MYTVSQLSKISGVSVRALQHYHRIGLLNPTKIGENGYRYYNEDKLMELQQILFFKEIDFKLSEIKKIMQNPSFSIEYSLLKQKGLMLLKIRRLQNIVDLIDKTVDDRKGEKQMSGKDYFEAVDEKTVNEYTERAKREYGEDIVNESLKNVQKVYNSDYNKIAREFSDWLESLKKEMEKGFQSLEVQSLIEKWYRIINRIFDCDLNIFSALGYGYRDNEEFAVNFRKADENMPEFVCDAIQYYCSEKKQETL
jgi:DNA-binding transcriptional MerR regulator